MADCHRHALFPRHALDLGQLFLHGSQGRRIILGFPNLKSRAVGLLFAESPRECNSPKLPGQPLRDTEEAVLGARGRQPRLVLLSLRGLLPDDRDGRCGKRNASAVENIYAAFVAFVLISPLCICALSTRARHNGAMRFSEGSDYTDGGTYRSPPGYPPKR